MIYGNCILAAADDFFAKLVVALTSKTALITYIALILFLIIVLAIRVILGEQQRVEQQRQSKRLKEEAEKDAVIESVSKKLDKHFERLGGDLNYVKRNLANTAGIPAPVRQQAAAAAATNTAGGSAGSASDDDKINLKELCEDFRNFSAGSLKLFYDIEDIRRFIGGLAVTKLIILQGMSGTGKTSLAYAFGEYLGNKTVVVPIQPMWKERTDLLGYYNEFTRRFNETTLLYKMYEANNNEEIYITVLDEMNIARVEYYFAEFLSLLEIPNPEGRNLDVVADRWEDDPKLLHSDGKMKLPTNMWFIGTANNDDSTFSISDKVYDRAMVINLDKKATPFEAEGKPRKVSATHLQELMDKAQREYALSDRNLRRLKQLDEYMIKTFHITFGNRIMKQIKCYVPVLVACGGTEVEALDDILARKIFRKLESKNPVYVKQMADGVCDYLDELFGENKLALCKETIRLIEQNV